ncbi:MAG: hypothetical protein R2849_00195 [Thermomicrobiales bacterium]
MSRWPNGEKEVRGLFDWLRNAPLTEPGFSALVLELRHGTGVLGGISGVIIGGVQINMLAHNTLTVPAHFHMTVGWHDPRP